MKKQEMSSDLITVKKAWRRQPPKGERKVMNQRAVSTCKKDQCLIQGKYVHFKEGKGLTSISQKSSQKRGERGGIKETRMHES